MKKNILFIILFCCKLYGHNMYVFQKSYKNDLVRIIFCTKQFELNKHNIVRDKKLHYVKLIDGCFPLGTDGNLPQIEIESINLEWNGEIIQIPKKFYKDCFEPAFSEKRMKIFFDDFNCNILVFMQGSENAGSYQVLWVFNKDQKHMRFSGHCSDCWMFDETFFEDIEKKSFVQIKICR